MASNCKVDAICRRAWVCFLFVASMREFWRSLFADAYSTGIVCLNDYNIREENAIHAVYLLFVNINRMLYICLYHHHHLQRNDQHISCILFVNNV